MSKMFMQNLALAPACGRNTVTERLVEGAQVVGPRINAPESGGEVVAGRGSWPWMASLGRWGLKLN